jgi:hypothetical protein
VLRARSCALFRRGLALEIENLNINILVHLKVQIRRFQVSIRTKKTRITELENPNIKATNPNIKAAIWTVGYKI